MTDNKIVEIIFRGAQGSGKTTLLRMCARALSAAGFGLVEYEEKDELRVMVTLRNIQECAGYRQKAEAKTDEVNHPAHYTQGGIECIAAIEAALTPEEFRGYCKGNAIKYTWREKHKGGNQSLEKAMWYMKRLLGKE